MDSFLHIGYRGVLVAMETILKVFIIYYIRFIGKLTTVTRNHVRMYYKMYETICRMSIFYKINSNILKIISHI